MAERRRSWEGRRKRELGREMTPAKAGGRETQYA